MLSPPPANRREPERSPGGAIAREASIGYQAGGGRPATPGWERHQSEAVASLDTKSQPGQLRSDRNSGAIGTDPGAVGLGETGLEPRGLD